MTNQSTLHVSNAQRVNCEVFKKWWRRERDCVDIITQLTAVRSSVDRIIELMIMENLTACINDPLEDPQAQKERLEKAVKYLIKRK